MPFEAATTSAAAAAALNNNAGHLFPSHISEGCQPLNASSKKKRKPYTKNVSTTESKRPRSKPTSTITSQQLVLQNLTHLPSTSSAAAAELLAGPSNPVVAAAAAAGMIAPRRPCKSYECRHCMAEFPRLKDRNSHLIEAHHYVRVNRRLICKKNPLTGAAVTAPSSTITSADLASTSAANMQAPSEIMEDSKQGIIKMEYDSNENQQSSMLSHQMTTKTEYEDNKDALALVPAAAGAVSTEFETKPNLQALQLSTPTTKLATLYRMLVTFNMTTLKQSQNISDTDEKLIESSIFFCYVCRQNFNSVKLYDAHLTEHAAECFTCGKKFQRWKNFSLHLKRHLGWKEFGCNVCEKKFVVRSALVEHMRMHTGQNPLKCKICGKFEILF